MKQQTQETINVLRELASKIARTVHNAQSAEDKHGGEVMGTRRVGVIIDSIIENVTLSTIRAHPGEYYMRMRFIEMYAKELLAGHTEKGTDLHTAAEEMLSLSEKAAEICQKELSSDNPV